MQSNYGKLPLSFEANRGQTDKAVDFLARGSGYSLFLKPTEAVFLLSRSSEQSEKKDIGQLTEKNATRQTTKPAATMQTAASRMKLVGGNDSASVAGAEETAGKVNYFIGNDKSKWQTDVPTFARVNYKNVYTGIDMTYYGNQQQLEYDFMVAPHADYKQIKLKFTGAKKIEIEKTSGDLLLHTRLGIMREHKPLVYQEINGERKEIASRYVRRGKNIGFEVAEYDPTLPLVIDPTLVYSIGLTQLN